MSDIPCVIDADYCGGHRIRVTFDDRVQKTIDFRPWLNGPVFEPLKDEEYFRRFFLDGWTIAWPNGADIAPETLYASATAPENQPDKRIEATTNAASSKRGHRAAGA